MRQTGDDMRTRILNAIVELTARNSRPPTNRELGQHLGGKSTGHIDYHLRILRQQGKIHHDPKKSRGIAVIGSGAPQQSTNGSRQVPIVGVIAAGKPIEAVLERDQQVNVLGLSFDDLFALRVRGTSMIDDLIEDGDIVICQRQNTAQNGDTVVALLTGGPSESGEATLKRFYQEDGQVRLQPRNPAMEPIFAPADEVLIQGKVVKVIRDL
ncbi:MAG: transcriptional repressor LexA [Chloroflexota bacterium]